MANYPQELAQDAVCHSHTGHMTGLWFLPTRPLRLNTNNEMEMEERNSLQKTERRNANWIGYILRTNCLLKHVIEGKIEGRIKVTEDDEEDLSSSWMT